MSLYKDIMEGNLAKREKREAEAAAAYKARVKAERDRWYKTMERELAHLPSRLAQLDKELNDMITSWLQDEGAEPGELTIRQATWDELQNSADFCNHIDGYPPVEEASRLTLEAGLALWIKGEDGLFGGVDGLVHFILDEDGGRWGYPYYDCDYDGRDHPFPTRKQSHWSED